MNNNIISTTDLQRNIKEVMTRLNSSSNPLVVVRDSQPTAVLMSYPEYQRLSGLEKSQLRNQMENILREMTIQNSKVKDEELDADILKARYASGRS